MWFDFAHGIRSALMTCLISGMAAGCVIWSAARPGSLEFADVEALSALDGVYRNAGEVEPGTPPIALSALIWPGEQLDHAAIETIDVRAVSVDTVMVRAVGAGGVVKESSFQEGREFHFEHGRLRIKRAGALLSEGSDDPLVGPRVEETELGIDLGGSGKYRSKARAAGLVYLVVPVVAHITEEVRFPKVGP